MTPEACCLHDLSGEGHRRSVSLFYSHDGDVWALLHLERGVHEAVLGHSGIGIDKEDDLPTDGIYQS